MQIIMPTLGGIRKYLLPIATPENILNKSRRGSTVCFTRRSVYTIDKHYQHFFGPQNSQKWQFFEFLENKDIKKNIFLFPIIWRFLFPSFWAIVHFSSSSEHLKRITAHFVRSRPPTLQGDF